MMTLVVGVPDSGKSALAESLAVEQSEGDKRIYIATMIPFGEEGQRRVEKHRKLREGKGFYTVEAPVNVFDSVKTEPGIGDATCLLECVSNLVGNVMHEGNSEDGAVVESVVSDIRALRGLCKNLVVVTNSFPLEGEGYDDDTRRYARLIMKVNEALRGLADKTFEYVDGEWREDERN